MVVAGHASAYHTQTADFVPKQDSKKQTRPKDNKSGTIPDLSLIEVTPHELALTQVMAEICPPLLTAAQKVNFAKAYDGHLALFMPTLDSKSVMQYLSDQSEYRAIVGSIKKWTLSFPNSENKALCVEFSNTAQNF